MMKISVRIGAGIRVRRHDPRLSAIKTYRRCALYREMAGDELVRPELAHGRVLLLNRYTIRDGVLHGGCFEVLLDGPRLRP